MKSRNQKLIEYEEKYKNIPKDYNERLSWMYDTLKISPSKSQEILLKRDAMLQSLQYNEFFIVLYEEPEGAKRPRFRIINRKNISNMAIANPDFIHVYSPNACADNCYMKRLITEEDFIPLEYLINTPCSMDICTYHKIPSGVSKTDIILSEIGLIRPPFYPDWDNIGKKYSDMFNENIWMDDDLVIDGSVHKFYSILPRIEIKISYLNMIYTKQMYDKISSRKNYDPNMNLQYFNMEECNYGKSAK